jgi:hypothetical protein
MLSASLSSMEAYVEAGQRVRMVRPEHLAPRLQRLLQERLGLARSDPRGANEDKSGAGSVIPTPQLAGPPIDTATYLRRRRSDQ